MITAVKLEDLREGDRASVLSLVGNQYDIARLSAMGIRGGARLQLLREGVPCIIGLDDSRLCLRPNKDLQIMVRPD